MLRVAIGYSFFSFFFLNNKKRKKILKNNFTLQKWNMIINKLANKKNTKKGSWEYQMGKRMLKGSFLVFLAAVLFFTGLNISAPSAKAEGTKGEGTKTEEVIDMSKINLKGVPSEKVPGLKKKIKEGKKLDSDKYMEKMVEEDGATLAMATVEDPYFRKDFPDGSFIENSIVDETVEVEKEEGAISTLSSVTQVGGGSEYRTLKVGHTSAWGRMSYRVQIYFPLGGNGKILKSYDWYYIGAVVAEDYKKTYRANETATADAVAIYRLVIGHTGINFIAKLDFRIRDGRYWSAYSS